MKLVKQTSRDNARQPLDWGEYALQDQNPDSVLNFYRKLIKLWREDQVISGDKLKVKSISKHGEFDFYRILGNRKYFIHLDLSNKTKSFCCDDRGTFLVTSR